MRYEFNAEKGEFTIFEPETGKNWYNQLWNGFGYHMTVSHTGLVHSRYVDAAGKQILLDADDSCIYLRNEDTGDFWNTGIAPVCQKNEDYKCVHGMNFSKISSSFRGIASELSFAASKRGTYGIMRLNVRNLTEKEVRLSLFTGVKFALDGFDMPAYYNAGTTTETVFDKNSNAVICLMENPFAPNGNGTGFVLSSEMVTAYEGNYEKFVGTAGNSAVPYVVRNGLDCSNSLATVRERGGVIQNKIILPCSGEKTMYYVMGFAESADGIASDFADMLKECETVFETAEADGERRFGSLRTASPEPRINNIMNFWAQKQVSYCMIGKKAVRDNAQLAMAILNFDTQLAKITLSECIAHQFADGHALLNWGISSDSKNLYSDPPMWLILSVCEYVKETGDFGFLQMSVPFEDGGRGTVYEHLKRAAQWYELPRNLGKNGLAKIHYADWNDALNIPDSDAESVFMSIGVCLAYRKLAELAKRVGDAECADSLMRSCGLMAEKINKSAYNGEYYVRAVGKFGNVGDKNCRGGKIYINPQVWAILADVVPKERMESVIKSIDSMENEYGIPICMPPYEEYDETVGRMSGMLPGVYENAGIYNHACGFKIMADCKIGRCENAMKTLLKAIPDGKSNPSSVTTAEPYVFVNCYLMHPAVKTMIGFSWQTGTSAWILRDYYEGILGLIRTYDGLMIKPCMPKAWAKAYAERIFRGNHLKINYIRGEENKITVDGTEISGNIIPNFDDGNDHDITVFFE